MRHIRSKEILQFGFSLESLQDDIVYVKEKFTLFGKCAKEGYYHNGWLIKEFDKYYKLVDGKILEKSLVFVCGESMYHCKRFESDEECIEYYNKMKEEITLKEFFQFDD